MRKRAPGIRKGVVPWPGISAGRARASDCHLVAGASVLSRDAANAPQEARVSGVTRIRIGSVRRTAAEILFRFVRATPQIHRASSRKVEMRPEVLGCGRHLGRSPNIPQFKTSRMNHERVWVDLRALLCLLCLGLR